MLPRPSICAVTRCVADQQVGTSIGLQKDIRAVWRTPAQRSMHACACQEQHDGLIPPHLLYKSWGCWLGPTISVVTRGFADQQVDKGFCKKADSRGLRTFSHPRATSLEVLGSHQFLLILICLQLLLHVWQFGNILTVACHFYNACQATSHPCNPVNTPLVNPWHYERPLVVNKGEETPCS